MTNHILRMAKKLAVRVRDIWANLTDVEGGWQKL